jgi:hypothetical protein
MVPEQRGWRNEDSAAIPIKCSANFVAHMLRLSKIKLIY